MRWAPYAVRTAALGMLLATAGVLVAQAPAHACKCVNTTTAEDAAAADAVFSGTVRETHKPEPDASGRHRSHRASRERAHAASVGTAPAPGHRGLG